MNAKKVHIILNPTSAGGKTGQRGAKILSLIEREVGDCYTLHITRGKLDATLSAAEALEQGCDLIVAIGGDGTIQEVVNGFFTGDHRVQSPCRLAVINCGTGHGFAQSLGLPDTLESQVRLLGSGQPRSVDIGRVAFQDGRGESCYRYFVNECQLGIGASVVRRVQANHKRLGGSLGFGLGVLETVFQHENQWMRLALDGNEVIKGLLTGVVVANGAFTGGGMNLAPTACLDDGTLKVLLMHNLSLGQRLWTFPKIYSGTHLSSGFFSYHESRCLTVCSEEEVFVEADGELLGRTPCEIEVLPSAIEVQSTSTKGV